MGMDFIEVGGKIAGVFLPFLFALSFHEYAHAWMARRKGDNTAELMGRDTLNPFAHADPIGTFVFPLLGLFMGGLVFGWAKPVPVNTRNLRAPKQDMFWIAIAGPLSNVLLAFVAGIALVAMNKLLLPNYTTLAIGEMLVYFIVINVLLALFNIIPVHPLDGGKVLERFIPYDWNRWLESNQTVMMFVLIGFLLLGGAYFLSAPGKMLAQFFLYLGS